MKSPFRVETQQSPALCLIAKLLYIRNIRSFVRSSVGITKVETWISWLLIKIDGWIFLCRMSLQKTISFVRQSVGLASLIKDVVIYIFSCSKIWLRYIEDNTWLLSDNMSKSSLVTLNWWLIVDSWPKNNIN